MIKYIRNLRVNSKYTLFHFCLDCIIPFLGTWKSIKEEEEEAAKETLDERVQREWKKIQERRQRVIRELYE